MNRIRKFGLLATLLGIGTGFGLYFLCILCATGIIGMFCWPYAINTWLVFADKPATIVWWQGFLMGFVPGFGAFSLPFTIVTWILMMFLT